jgi:hypothetical protein
MEEKLDGVRAQGSDSEVVRLTFTLEKFVRVVMRDTVEGGLFNPKYDILSEKSACVIR